MAKAKGFQFKVERGVAVPLGRGGRASSHPFPWDTLKPGDSFVVTKDYWIKERGEKPQHYDANKMRERIRANFRVWQEKDSARSKITLAMATLEPSGDIRVGFRKA
jgi:hypothetical protein